MSSFSRKFCIDKIVGIFVVSKPNVIKIKITVSECLFAFFSSRNYYHATLLARTSKPSAFVNSIFFPLSMMIFYWKK